MREIKFRGKTEEGKWVYGSHQHVIRKGRCELIIDWDTNIPHEVIQETVGQFTGLKDKNGVDIYEGDKYAWSGSMTGEIFNGVVTDIRSINLKRWDSKEYEVTGNIHDKTEEDERN